MFPDIPNWLTAIGTFIGGAAAIWALIKARIKNKKTLKDTQFYDSLSKDTLLNSILFNIKHEFANVELASIVAFTNHAKPTNHQTLYSTDVDTQALWKTRQPMEPALANLVFEMINHGMVRYGEQDIKNPITKDWYEMKGIKKTYQYTVGIGEFYLEPNEKSEQALVALLVNITDDYVMKPEQNIKIQTYLSQVKDVIQKMTVNNKLIN